MLVSQNMGLLKLFLFQLILIVPCTTLSLPQIITTEKPVNALASGDNLSLTCIASGDPSPQIEWLKDGQKNYTRAKLSRNHTILSISHAKPGDSGNYSCIATNAAGIARRTTIVTVFSCTNVVQIGVANQSKIDHSKMKASSEFRKSWDSYTVKHGRLHGQKAWCPSQKKVDEWLEVDLGAIYHVCGVATQGKEHRTNEWTTKFKLGFSVYNTSRKIYRVGGKEKEFMGNQDPSTVVVNSLPTMQLAQFVRFYPTAFYLWPCLRVEIFVEIVAPSLIKGPENQTTVQGGSVILPCKVSGSPMPNVTWFFNSRNVISGKVLKNGSLTIRQVAKAFEGWYTCVASSHAGSVRFSAYLRVYVLPTIVTPLKSSTALSVGDSLLLTCQTSGDPMPQIKWLKNGSTGIKRAKITKNYTVLSISRVEPSDSGTYECVARNLAGATKSRSSVAVFRCSNISEIGVANHSKMDHSKLKASSEFGKIVDYLTVKYGRLNGPKAWCPRTKEEQSWLEIDLGAVYLVCGVATQGKEHRTNEWTTKFKLAFSVDNTTANIYKIDGKEKEFQGNEDQSSVVITPLLTMQWARIVRFYPTEYHLWPCLRVEVFVETTSPTILQRPTNQTAVAGDNVTLDCIASGSPKPKIIWRFNKQNLPDGKVLNNGSLIINDVQNNKAHEGHYTCHVLSPLGSSQASAYVQVFEKPQIVSKASPKVAFVATKTATLICQATGDPLPYITWLKNGIPIGSSPRYIYQQNRALLKISPVRPRDSGIFTCLAASKYGSVNSSTFVQVINRPTIETNKTRSLIKTVLGVSTMVACFVKSGLPVTFKWTKNGLPLASRNSMKVYENVLVITTTRKEDFGIFTCIASNDAGTISVNITVGPANSSVLINGKVRARQYSKSVNNHKVSVLVPLLLLIAASVGLNVYVLYRLLRRRRKRQRSEIQLSLIGPEQDESPGSFAVECGVEKSVN